MVSGGMRLNQLGAPPLVNFALSIELYIKLLRHIADACRMRGHNLYKLFLELEKVAPDVACLVMCKHHYTRGDRDEFLDYLKAEAVVFEEWRYTYQRNFFAPLGIPCSRLPMHFAVRSRICILI